MPTKKNSRSDISFSKRVSKVIRYPYETAKANVLYATPLGKIRRLTLINILALYISKESIFKRQCNLSGKCNLHHRKTKSWAKEEIGQHQTVCVHVIFATISYYLYWVGKENIHMWFLLFLKVFAISLKLNFVLNHSSLRTNQVTSYKNFLNTHATKCDVGLE